MLSYRRAVLRLRISHFVRCRADTYVTRSFDNTPRDEKEKKKKREKAYTIGGSFFCVSSKRKTWWPSSELKGCAITDTEVRRGLLTRCRLPRSTETSAPSDQSEGREVSPCNVRALFQLSGGFLQVCKHRVCQRRTVGVSCYLLPFSSIFCNLLSSSTTLLGKEAARHWGKIRLHVSVHQSNGNQWAYIFNRQIGLIFGEVADF